MFQDILCQHNAKRAANFSQDISYYTYEVETESLWPFFYFAFGKHVLSTVSGTVWGSREPGLPGATLICASCPNEIISSIIFQFQKSSGLEDKLSWPLFS